MLAVTEEDDTLATPNIDTGGNFITVKTGNRVALPMNIEQYRHRVALWGASWIFASSMHSSRHYLQDLDPMTFTHYVNHMLGEHVMGLIADGPVGTQVVGDLWIKFLDYDYEIRKECLKQAERDRKTFGECLRSAYGDTEVKMKYFTDPVQFKLRKRKADDMVEPTVAVSPPGGKGSMTRSAKRRLSQARAVATAAAAAPAWVPPGKGKGGKKGKKGKGKGKGKSKSKTPAGKPICFAFNGRGEWCPGDCGREHVCGVCFAPNRPMYSCDHAGPAAPTG